MLALVAIGFAAEDGYGECSPIIWFERSDALQAKGNSLGLNLNDFDGDGDNDVLVATAPARIEHAVYYSGETRLYRNDGDLNFVEVGAEWGLNNACEDRSPVYGDLDGDGQPDLYYTVNGRNRLYRNTGGARFDDVSAQSGAAAHPGWGHEAMLLDYDRDGLLDVFFSNGPEDGSGENVLMRNQGDGSFRDVSVEAGITGSPSGKGVCVLDVDNDGWMDVFVTTGRAWGNELYMNQRDGTFLDQAVSRGVSDPARRFGVGVGCGDLDGDGDPDIALVTHDKDWSGNQLFRNDGGRFTDIAPQVGFAEFTDGHGLALEDLDLDGDLDVVMAGINTEPVLFRNDGDWEWTRLCDGGGIVQAHGVTWAVASADLDGDAYPEVLISNGLGRRPRSNNLYRNINDGGHWLTVEVDGLNDNPSQLGARVQVVAGDQIVTRWVGTWFSFDSQGPLPITFGLGDATRVDEVRVRFTDGSIQVLSDVGVDQHIVVVAEGRADDDRDGVPNEWDVCPMTVLGQSTDADGCAPMQRLSMGVAPVSPPQDAIVAAAPEFQWDGAADSAVVQLSVDGTWGIAGRWDFGPVTGNSLQLTDEQWAALPKDRVFLWRVATWREDGAEGLSSPRRLHPAVESDRVRVPYGANVFEPANIVVDVGTTVTWWNDSVSAGNLQNEPHDVQLYSGAGTAISPMRDFDGGGVFTWTFDTPGVWSSVCHRHSGVPGGVETTTFPRAEGAFGCMAATVTVR
jgi:enediyne biosynthesis protein E4